MAGLFPRKHRRSKKRASWLGPAALALLVLVTLIATVYFIFLRGGLPGPEQARKPTETATPPRQPRTIAGRHPVASRSRRPRVVIVIDDMGYNRTVGEKMLGLDLNLTFSFLPHGPQTRRLARQAAERGRDILLHLPMEAADPKWDNTPGILLLSMNAQALQNTFARDLAQVPMAIGVNNHMGSRFTSNRTAMTRFFRLLQARNLFFLDSLTTSGSVGYQLARDMGLRTVKRNVFLDNVQNRTAILRQLAKVVSLARKNGFAIGIGHPHPETLAALVAFKNRFNGRQPELVGIHDLFAGLPHKDNRITGHEPGSSYRGR